MLKPFWSKKKKLSYTAEQVNDAIGQVIEGGVGGGKFYKDLSFIQTDGEFILRSNERFETADDSINAAKSVFDNYLGIESEISAELFLTGTVRMFFTTIAVSSTIGCFNYTKILSNAYIVTGAGRSVLIAGEDKYTFEFSLDMIQLSE